MAENSGSKTNEIPEGNGQIIENPALHTLQIGLDVDCAEAITGLKAVQRELKAVTAAAKEMQEALKKGEINSKFEYVNGDFSEISKEMQQNYKPVKKYNIDVNMFHKQAIEIEQLLKETKEEKLEKRIIQVETALKDIYYQISLPETKLREFIQNAVFDCFPITKENKK